MADLYKVTWFFSYGRGGFSNSHYTMTDGYAATLTKAKALLQLQMACMGTGVKCNYIRVSRDDIPGDAMISALDYITVNNDNVVPADVTIKTIINDKPDAWWTAALIRLGSSATTFGRLFFRGIPDSIVVLPNGFSNDIAWDKGMLAYFDKLVADGWGMKAVPKGNAVRKKIANIVNNGAAGWTITTAVAHDLFDGAKIRISGFKGGPASNVNGLWTANVTPTGTTITIGPTQSNFNVENPVTSFGQLWTQEKLFATYSRQFMALVRITERKAGRPFDSLVGRRPARV